MRKKQKQNGHSATDKERGDTKHLPKNGVIDGVGGMGGSSGAGGERARVDYIGEISGIDIKTYRGEIPVPGSTGRSAHSSHGLSHTESERTEQHHAARRDDE